MNCGFRAPPSIPSLAVGILVTQDRFVLCETIRPQNSSRDLPMGDVRTASGDAPAAPNPFRLG